MKRHLACLALFAGLSFSYGAFAQGEEEEEDWDLYGELEFVDEKGGKAFAKPTIVGMSPQRFFMIGWDVQTPYDMRFSQTRFPASENTGFGVDENPDPAQTARANYTGGFRFNSVIPVISKSNLVWQSGINFMDVRYQITDIQGDTGGGERGLAQILNEDGLRNLNWTNTVFVPINEKSFFVFQGQLDMSGNFDFGFQPFNTVRVSAAAIYGKRVSDLKRWGVGLSRTYRVGNMNYIPVVMYDWTSPDRKWGTEILFPARASGRYNFSKTSLLLFGFELEGQSYRIDEFSRGNNSFEIRRGELRPRLEYQKQITGPFWFNMQAGYRFDWSFDADELDGGREFFRGFFGTQEFGMRNNLGNPLYFNVGISFVTL